MVAFALVAALAACQAHATVTVRMHADGSGVVAVRVALDAAAVRTAEVGGGTLAGRVRLDDLHDAGWTVTPWRRTGGGGAVLTVAKPFARPEQVGPIVRELNGAHGPLPRLRRVAGRVHVLDRVEGARRRRPADQLDLGITADPELVAKLTGERVDVAGVEQRIAASARTGLRVAVRAELPDGSARQVAPSPGKRAALVATADDTDLGRIVLVVVGIAVGILALVLLVLGESRARRRRARRSVRSRP